MTPLLDHFVVSFSAPANSDWPQRGTIQGGTE